MVTILNLIIVSQHGRAGGSLGIQYRSSLPSSHRDAQLAEAREVVESYGGLAETQGYSMSAQICNTMAAAETREAPERLFHFARGSTGTWEFLFAVSADGTRES